MAEFSTVDDCCPLENAASNKTSGLRSITSTILSNPSAVIARLSAVGLVLASAGLGAVYAWTTGAQHGFVLACLMTLMAIALELAKPLAIAGSFVAFRSWSVGKGLSLALLAVIAIAYSLTAELTLMAGARGDLIAEREAALSIRATNRKTEQRKNDAYERARNELDQLPPSRPVSVVQAEIDGLLLKPGTEGCQIINGRVTRKICPKVASLRIEKGTAERKAELNGILAKALARTPTRSEERSVRVADPGAQALSTYLAALGIELKAGVVTEWLALVPVLALEIGSALALVLVQAWSNKQQTVTASTNRIDSATRNKEPPQRQSGPLMVQANVSGDLSDDSVSRDDVANAILDQLKTMGGSAKASERGLAKLIGVSKTTVRRALHSMTVAGVVASEASRNGTSLRILA